MASASGRIAGWYDRGGYELRTTNYEPEPWHGHGCAAKYMQPLARGLLIAGSGSGSGGSNLKPCLRAHCAPRGASESYSYALRMRSRLPCNGDGALRVPEVQFLTY